MGDPAKYWNEARAARRLASRVSSFMLIALLPLALWLMDSLGWVGANQIAAMAIGALVGAVEILGRYRHSPVRAMITWNGLSYILINMGASWCAYYMLDAFNVFEADKVAKDLKEILTAGFGSLVFMRSSLFKIRIGESDIGIGPAAILDTLLLVADRGVDRREAVARAQDVTELVAHVHDPRIVAKMLTKYSLALMQNVDEKTSQDVIDAISKIMADGEVPDTIKMDIVALRLGVIVGPDVLEAAVAALGDRLNAALDTSLPALPSEAKPPAAPAAPVGLGPLVAPPTFDDLKAEIDKSKRP